MRKITRSCDSVLGLSRGWTGEKIRSSDYPRVCRLKPMRPSAKPQIDSDKRREPTKEPKTKHRVSPLAGLYRAIERNALDVNRKETFPAKRG